MRAGRVKKKSLLNPPAKSAHLSTHWLSANRLFFVHQQNHKENKPRRCIFLPNMHIAAFNIYEYQQHRTFCLVGFKQVQKLCYYFLHYFKHVVSFLFLQELEILLKI